MAEKRVPGICAQHAIITDECRANRGDDGAIDEALQRIRRELRQCANGWDRGNGVHFHVVLTVDRPSIDREGEQ